MPDTQKSPYTYLRGALAMIGIKRMYVSHQGNGRYVLVITSPQFSGCITVRDEREELFGDVRTFTGWRASHHVDDQMLETVHETERIYGLTYADDATAPVVGVPPDSAQCAGAIHRWITART